MIRSFSNSTVALFSFGILLVIAMVVVRVSTNKTPQTTQSKASALSPTPQAASLDRLEGALVAGFPEFPLYPGVGIDYSYVKRQGQQEGYEAEMKSPQTVAVIGQWYVNALPAAGWTVLDVPESLATITPPGPLSDIEFMIVAEKNGRRLNLIIEDEHEAGATEIYAEFPLQ